MRALAGWFLGSIIILVGCTGKPCDPIPHSDMVKSLGFVLEGGRLCKDADYLAFIDYPAADTDNIHTLTFSYKDALENAGWKVDVRDRGKRGGALYAKRDNAEIAILTQPFQGAFPAT